MMLGESEESEEREEDNGVKSGQRMYRCEQKSKSDWVAKKVEKGTKQGSVERDLSIDDDVDNNDGWKER